MRKITQLAVNAFMNNEKFTLSNTEIIKSTNNHDTIMRLHGNNIAIYNGKNISISTAGWNTPTTRERLNGIPGVRVYVKKGVLFLNGKEWDGNWKAI